MDGNQGVGAGMALGLARAGMAGRSACGMGPGSGALLRRAWGLWRARAGVFVRLRGWGIGRDLLGAPKRAVISADSYFFESTKCPTHNSI